MSNPLDPRPSLSGTKPTSRPILYGPMLSGGGVRPLLGRAGGEIGVPAPGLPGLTRLRPSIRFPGELFPISGYDSCPAGPFGASSFVNEASVGAVAWTTPANSQFSDDAYVTATTVAQDTQRLNVVGLGFRIDPIKTVAGILVEVEAKVLVGTATVVCRIIKGGTVSSTTKSNTWTTTEGFVSYGGSTDLWGETWTPNDINETNFGVSIRQEALLTSTLSCDFVRVTIYCSTAGRITKNTRAFPLGQFVGMGQRMHMSA